MIADAVNSATNSGAPESSPSDTSSTEGVAVPAPPDPVTVLSNSISNSSKNSRAQLEKNFENLKANRPANLLSGSEGDSAMAALAATGAKKISFERLQGFDGIDEFEPSGWQVEVQGDSSAPEPEGGKEPATIWPKGVGMAIMNRCYGTGYQKGDPCYELATAKGICLNQIDAANFIGVGFDGRGYYSAESRKKSIIQRICDDHGFFAGKDVPDIMNAFGVYGKLKT